MSIAHESSHARVPWLAMALTMCCPGLGQLYCGKAARGLVMFGLFAMFGPLVVGLSYVATSTASLLVFMACTLIYLSAGLWIALDAYRIARQMKGRSYTLQDYNQLVVYVLLLFTSIPYSIGLAFFLRANVVEAFIIPTSSMAPTLIPGDRILSNKLGISTRTFARGDLIVFRNPENRRQLFVKRIVGLSGDRVEIQRGELLVNGEPLPPVPASASSGSTGAVPAGQIASEQHANRRASILDDKQDQPSAWSAQKVPAGSYFVLGDNRELSRDSRNFGFLSHGEIIGVVTYRYWPADTWSRFGPVR